MGTAHGFVCSQCGEKHSDLPDLAFNAPYHYSELNETERKRAKLSADFCEIDQDRFVRGVLPITI